MDTGDTPLSPATGTPQCAAMLSAHFGEPVHMLAHIRDRVWSLATDDPAYPLIGFTVMAFFVGYLLVTRLMHRVVRSNHVFDENGRTRAHEQGARPSRAWDSRERPKQERKRARRATDADEAEDEEGEAYDARDQLHEHEARTRDVRHYARVLGLKGRVTPDVLRARYRELAAQYHPDKVHHLGPKLQALAVRELKAINEAHAYFKKRWGL